MQGAEQHAPEVPPPSRFPVVKIGEVLALWAVYLALQLVKSLYNRCAAPYFGIFACQVCDVSQNTVWQCVRIGLLLELNIALTAVLHGLKLQDIAFEAHSIFVKAAWGTCSAGGAGRGHKRAVHLASQGRGGGGGPAAHRAADAEPRPVCGPRVDAAHADPLLGHHPRRGRHCRQGVLLNIAPCYDNTM